MVFGVQVIHVLAGSIRCRLCPLAYCCCDGAPLRRDPLCCAQARELRGDAEGEVLLDLYGVQARCVASDWR